MTEKQWWQLCSEDDLRASIEEISDIDKAKSLLDEIAIARTYTQRTFETTHDFDQRGRARGAMAHLKAKHILVQRRVQELAQKPSNSRSHKVMPHEERSAWSLFAASYDGPPEDAAMRADALLDMMRERFGAP